MALTLTGARRAPSSHATPRPVRVVAVLVAGLCMLPIAVVATKAFGVGPARVAQLLFRPRVGELLQNTVWLVLLTTTITTVVGVGAAWLVERTTLPGAGWWRVAMVCPLAVPAFVNAFAWVTVLPWLEGLAGAVLVTSLSYFPFVFLPIAAVLRGLDRGLEDSARSLGLGPWRSFRRAVLPQLRPAVLGGALLVGLHLLSEYGVLSMLRYPTFTTAILDQYQVAFNDAAGAVLSCALVLLCLTLLTIEHFARGHARQARLGRGTATRPLPARLGRLTPVALGGLGLLTVLSLGVPAWSLGRWIVAGARGAQATSVDASADLDLAGPLWGTLQLALSAALLTTVLAFPVAWLVARAARGATSGSWLATAVERSTYISSSLPGVVIALALVTVSIRYLPAVYQTALVLVLAYTILFIPRAMVTIRASIALVPPELGEASRSLGQGPARTFWRVQLPLTLRGALAGFALVFIAVTTELTATLILSPIGTTTLSTAFWNASESLDYAAAAPYALAMVLLSAPLTWLLMRGTERTDDSGSVGSVSAAGSVGSVGSVGSIGREG